MEGKEREYNYKISEIGNYLAQWPGLDFASKETLQNIAKFVLSEKNKSKAEGVIEKINILLDFTNLWLKDCEKYPSQVAGIQRKIFEMYKIRFEKLKQSAEKELEEK